MADWAGLRVEILVSILEKVRFIEDFVVSGSVCKSWWEAASNNKRYYLRPDQTPWLMLMGRKHCWQVRSLSKDYNSMKSLCIPEMVGKFCIGLNYGWVLTISHRGEMNLVHPLSRSLIQLPNGRSDFYMDTSCAALSANPSETSNFVLMIILRGAAVYLRYGGLGDQQYWTRIAIPNRTPLDLYSDLIYYHDRFYGVCPDGEVWGFNVSDPRDCFLVTDLSSVYPNTRHIKKYIVASEGDLLVVVGDPYLFSFSSVDCEIEVYKMDLINGKHEQIKSLGDRSIFVGQNTSISVDVSESRRRLINSNHIYFADKVKGCYSLEDGQFTKFKARRRHTSFEMNSRLTFWFIPSF